jgi:DMSO/TMAO reductase YedYZ molybdopterin-dependent catalytic subunit
MTTRQLFYRIGMLAVVCAGLIAGEPPPPQSASPVISVSGDVATPLTLKAEDLVSMPREKVTVPEPDGTQVEYEGVPLREILKKAGLPLGKVRGKALTTYILAKARDGYEVVFTLGEIDSEFGNEEILVADKRDGKALSGTLGPWRLVLPHDEAGARSVRMLESLEIVQLQK